MTHTHYARVNMQTGAVELCKFNSAEGAFLGWGDIPNQRFAGFPTNPALLIVNRWNYLSTLQLSVKPSWFYYLPTVEGASTT